MTGLIIVGGKVEIKDVKTFIARLSAIGKECGVTVQAVNADLVAGRGHIEFAADKAVEAFRERGTWPGPGHGDHAVPPGPPPDREGAGDGVREGKNNVAIVIVGDEPGCAEDKARAVLDMVDEKVVDYGHHKDEALMRLYDITPAEVEIVGEARIPLLARERSALLEFEK